MNRGKEKGVTLIALIITIIVMLILVAAAVRTSVNSGLFGHAKEATERWASEERKEVESSAEVDKVLYKYVEKHDWKRTGDTLYCEHCKTELEIGEYLAYEPDETATEIEISAANSGGEGTQKFTQEKDKRWRVIGAQDTNGNGTNETLVIKMETPTNVGLYLKGAAGYNNGADIMNKICKELYSSSTYGEARSITIDDVNNTLQYSQNALYMDYSEGIHEVDGINNKLKNIIPSDQWARIVELGTKTPDGTNTEEKLGTYILNGYYYNINGTTITNPVTNKETNITEKEVDAIGANSAYWFANSGSSVSSAYVVFGLGNLEAGIVYSFNDLFYNIGEEYDYTYSVCPVVLLRNEIPEKTN